MTPGEIFRFEPHTSLTSRDGHKHLFSPHKGIQGQCAYTQLRLFSSRYVPLSNRKDDLTTTFCSFPLVLSIDLASMHSTQTIHYRITNFSPFTVTTCVERGNVKPEGDIGT